MMAPVVSVRELYVGAANIRTSIVDALYVGVAYIHTGNLHTLYVGLYTSSP